MTGVEAGRVGPAQEGRQFTRFATGLTVQVRREDLAALVAAGTPARPEAALMLELDDFSLGGLGATSPRALWQGERVTVRLPSIGARPAARLTGRVARCAPRDERFDVGIEFCQIDEDPKNSPWRRIAGLFYLSTQYSRSQRPAARRPAGGVAARHGARGAGRRVGQGREALVVQ